MSVAKFALVILVFCFAALQVAGCDMCGFGGFGSGPDPEPEETAVMLTLAVGADTSSTIQESAADLVRQHTVYGFVQPFTERKASVDPVGRRVLAERTMYEASYGPAVPIDLPDSLRTCTFVFDVAAPLLCVVTLEGLVVDPFTGVVRRLATARTYLGFVADNLAERVLGDTAQFISAERYRIDRPEHVVMSADGRMLFVLSRRETRQIVTNAAGDVVNDFVYSSQPRLGVLPVAAPEDVTALPISLLEHVGSAAPLLVIAEDGSYAAIAAGGTIRVVATEDTSKVQSFGGYYPQIVGNRLVAAPLPLQNETFLVYDLSSGEVEEVTAPERVSAWTLQSESERIYYTGGEDVWYYDLTSKRHVKVYSFSSYVRHVEEADPNYSVRSGGLFFVASLNGRPSQIAVFGVLSRTFVVQDEC